VSRLIILTDSEQKEFDYPPVLSTESRAVCFSINDELSKKINQLRTPANQVGFLIQYAYFTATKRFFIMDRFSKKDVSYAAKILGIPFNEVEIKDYKGRIPAYHQSIILDLLNYKPFDQDQKVWIDKEITHRVSRILEPRKLFFEILHLLHTHHIEIPSYHRLVDMITQHYLDYENSLLSKVESSLTKDQKKALQVLLAVPKKNTSGTLNRYKSINQSTQPKGIQASLNDFGQFEKLAKPIFPFLEVLSLTPQCCQYYATWVKKAKLSQIKQFSDENKLYVRLAAFLQHQYYARQDTFVDIFLRCVQSSKNTSLHKLTESDQLSRSERRSAVRHLTKTRRVDRVLIDEITEIIQSSALTDSGKVARITELLEEHRQEEDEKEQKKLASFEKSLDAIAKDKDYFDILESLSKKLQTRVSGILKVLIFNKDNSDKKLLKAIQYYKDTDGQLTNAAPITFLSETEQAALTDDKKTFRVSLYKTLLFVHVADAIKSGALNLRYSYRYLAIQDYLIDEATWRAQRKELLKLSKLEDYANCSTVMEKLKVKLNEKYHAVNHRFKNKQNPYLTINADKNDRVHVTTPALDDKETKHISALLGQVGYIPILRLLSDVNNITNFSECFTHHNIKHSKSKPRTDTFLAGIIGLGCNIGVSKMAQISSGINRNMMLHTVKWYFTIKALNAANQRVREFINRLALPNIFIADLDQRHGSSDGQKVGVAVESSLATCSFKYFGKDKGLSIYTFIDERQVLFHHNVMSSAEREAAYVIDGLNNHNVAKIDIHSTDSHGYTELIFATTHFLDVTFAPRLKNIGKQKIYDFSTKKSYESLGYQILPSRQINQKRIECCWDDTLRFMATIKLNKVSASQLFKRLSSYAKDHPLYKAIKEFGRVIKSLFILTYYDDVKLRQRIEKQLNRIESSNKFAKAVFYANNSEFKQADPDDQNIAVACKVLIQNSIVLWNYLYLSEILANCSDDSERNEMLSMIKEGSILTWSHVNLHGEFDFKRYAANDHTFNLSKILALKIK
jgi:TnpA family transposase